VLDHGAWWFTTAPGTGQREVDADVQDRRGHSRIVTLQSEDARGTTWML
jgi:hypothetical protein